MILALPLMVMLAISRMKYRTAAQDKKGERDA
jgi:hypothetical protein